MTGTVLVTGATGNVGSEVARRLVARGVRMRAAVRGSAARDLVPGVTPVAFDYLDSSTFGAALQGVDRVFLVRPPHLADASAFQPFIDAMQDAGITQVVFLSLLGVERNPVVPHHGIERRIMDSGLHWTMLRPGFYMQNLSTTHLADVRERGEIIVPAGGGKTSFIDVRDIAEAAAVVLTEVGHLNRAYSLTGSEALTYYDVARILTEVVGRTVTYTRPGGQEFARHMRAQGHDSGFVTVMRGIYLVARLRMAGTLTDDLPNLIGRPAITFAQFARDHASLFAVQGA